MAATRERLGLYGFGAAAHILVQVARAQGRRVFAFTRPGDDGRAGVRARARRRVGRRRPTSAPPEPLDAAIIFAPDGALVPVALRALAPGGTVVCGGIHMSDIPSFPYAYCGRSAASAPSPTSRAPTARSSSRWRRRCRSRRTVTATRSRRANEALADLRAGRFTGAAVVVPDHA